MLANVRSLKGKLNDFQTLAYEYDFICFTETHLDSTFADGQLLPDCLNMKIIRKDRNQFGGGVLMAIRNSLAHATISIDLDIAPLETVAVHIPSRHKSVSDLIIMCVYIPPSKISSALEPLDILMNYIENKFPMASRMILGDFNMPEIDWSQMRVKPDAPRKNTHQLFLHFLNENNLAQRVMNPTHVLGNILDLVLVDEESRVGDISVINPGLSDHYMVRIELCSVHQKLLPLVKSVKLYDKADKPAIRSHLLQTLDNVEQLISCHENINDIWSVFESDLRSAVHDFVPTHTIKREHPHEPPFFNHSARKAVQQQRKLYNKYKKTGADHLLTKYKALRRENKKLFRKLERDYFMNKIYEPLEHGQSKPFYSYVKRVRGRSCTSVKFGKSEGDDSELDVVDVANNFNKFFHSVFNIACPIPPIPPGICNITISSDGVLLLIQGLANGKAPGPDHIRKADLFIDLYMTSKILALIFQYSITNMVVPDSWKVANVVPVFKKGDKAEYTNYRPVSLTSICCKLMEHIILSKLNSLLEGKIHSSQHGFRKGLSCTTQLVTTVHNITSIVDSGHRVHAAILDFSKAFDKVSHGKLISKPVSLKIDPCIIWWIVSFLSDRKQRVILDGKFSDLLDVTSGVPQGTVLGPMLFLIYINDIVNSVTHSQIRLFADDVLMFNKISKFQDMVNFQQDLNSLSLWADKSDMSFNVKKCQVVCFGSGDPVYFMDNKQLTITKLFKYLGVEIASTFSWDQPH